MLKVACETDAQQAPLEFMSAQFEGVLRPQALRWVWFFFCKMGDTSDEISVCTQGALLLVTVDWAHFSKGQSFIFWGSCHSTSSRGTQHFWHRTFSPGKELQEVDEHWGRGTCSPWAHWFVLFAVSEYWSIQAVILNIHMICDNCVLTWRTFFFFFFQFQDDEKQRQRSHSWIKNKRTVDSTDKIHFQRSGDENESVSLSHCWRLKKKKEMRLCF